MKKIDLSIDNWLDTLNKRWQKIPVKLQRRYTICLFVAYLFLTTVVILNVWYTASGKSLSLIHI